MECKKSLAIHAREGILIFLGAGIVIGFLLWILDFPSDRILLFTVFNSVMWVMMWKGNEFIAEFLDVRIPWLQAPARRFLVGLAAMLIYVIFAATLIVFLFRIVLHAEIGIRQVSGEILQSTLIAVVITMVIMLFIYSRSFFSSWRQAAINVEKLKRESIASQYEVLKNQVNPHFLFNTLNALTALIYEDRDKAIRFINKFSDVYRYVLESRDKEVVPVEEELNFVRSFIFLLQVRHEDNLTVEIRDNNQAEGYIPPMSVQLLVENAVKHNVIASELKLKIMISADRHEIVVENNITAGKETRREHEGMGLKNLISRYEILSGKPVRIENDGSIFRVFLPVLKMDNP